MEYTKHSSEACAACQKSASVETVMNCSKCSLVYHYLCLRISEKDFVSYTTSQKAAWLCPNCSKCVKKGDNTPVRSTVMDWSIASDSSPPSWITRRAQVLESGNISLHQCITADEVREIIRTELRSVLARDVGQIVHQCLLPELQNIRSELNQITTSMEHINHQYEEMRSKIDEKAQQLNLLQNENEKLLGTVRDLNSRMTLMEQQSRSANIEIQCVPEHRTENLKTLVMQLSRAVSCPLQENHIMMCTRTAKLNPESKRPRSIVIRFCTPAVRDDVLAAVMKYNKANPNDKLSTSHLGIGGDKNAVYVAEHLSPYNRVLHQAARKAAKDKNYKFVWVRNGRVFVRKNETSQLLNIKDLDSIKRM